MVEDIVFVNTQHVIEEIQNMNVKGGSPFGRAAAWAYKLAAEQEAFENFEALSARFQMIASKLVQLKPTMATIHNVNDLVLKLININRQKKLESILELIIQLCQRIIDYSFTSVDKLAEFGANLISSKKNSNILMHSYTSSLMAVFEQAAKNRANFSVICTESRPLRESAVAIRKLKELDIPVTLITDASICEFLPNVDVVLVGADTITWHGDVANKIGTKLIAKLADSYKVPVYVASEVLKIDKRTLYGHVVELEKRDKEEVIRNTEFESIKNLDVVNQFFDLTPSSLIHGIICEEGIVVSAQIGQYWERIEKQLLKF